MGTSMTREKGTYQRQLKDWKRRRLKRMREGKTASRRLYDERTQRDELVSAEYGDFGHRSCGRKFRYETEADALSMAARCVLKGAPELRAYHCKMCGGWHLTKKLEA